MLNLVSGVYGKGFAVWARRHGAEVVELQVPYNEAIDPAAVERALKARPDIRVVSVCHHETPSGTLNPVAEIGAVVAAHGGFLIVDAVSSFGGMDVHPEAVHADIFVASPSKCLGATPGLTLLGISARAWEKMRSNPDAPRAPRSSACSTGNMPGGATAHSRSRRRSPRSMASMPRSTGIWPRVRRRCGRGMR